MRKRAVIFVRIAHPPQFEGALSGAELQHHTCKGFCKTNSLEVVGSIVEIGAGRGLSDRSKLDELREMVRGGHVDYVIVHSLSRLSRKNDDLIALAHEAEQHGVGIYSVFEQLPGEDITPLQAQALILERERWSAIYAQVEKQESVLPYGYRFGTDTDGKLPDAESAPDVERIFREATDTQL